MWMRSNPGARIPYFDIAALVNSAFSKAARLDIAQSRFKCSGIYPFERDIFTELDFLPSQMTNVEEHPVLTKNIPCNTTAATSQLPNSDNQLSAPVIKHPTSNENSNQQSTAAAYQPSTSRNQQSTAATTDSSQPSTHHHKQTDVSPNTSYQLLKQLSPLPDASKKRLQTRSRKTQRSEILTSSPYEITLVEKANDTKKKPATHEDCVYIDAAEPYYYCEVCTAKERLVHH